MLLPKAKTKAEHMVGVSTTVDGMSAPQWSGLTIMD